MNSGELTRPDTEYIRPLFGVFITSELLQLVAVFTCEVKRANPLSDRENLISECHVQRDCAILQTCGIDILMRWLVTRSGVC